MSPIKSSKPQEQRIRLEDLPLEVLYFILELLRGLDATKKDRLPSPS